VTVEEQQIEVDGLLTHYLAAGEGPPLLLLHALGESALDWRWVLPDLARTHRVYAPDLPGFGDSAKPTADYSPVFFEGFVAAFLDALEVERAAVVGNSLGGLIALRLALSEPARTSALALIDSAGLGREVSSALESPTLPGYGEMLVTLSKTPLGATQRTWLRLPLLFARPERVPPSGSRNSTGWRNCRASRKRWWQRYARRSSQEGNVRCWWIDSPAWRFQRSSSGESPTVYSLSLKHEKRSPAFKRALSSSSRTAVTCPTSNDPTASLPPSSASSGKKRSALSYRPSAGWQNPGCCTNNPRGGPTGRR
jgi:pimeloyl-ACP methyl ester carboxylesterase